jgi:CheY-like chemotaxis protein
MGSGNVKQGHKKTILCVDDEIAILSSLARTLRPLPYRVVTATDGVKALEMVNQEKPDLIISDVKMPRMDGYEFIKQLHAKGLQELPVVLLTGDDDLARGYQEGCVYYITKPYKKDYLINIIEYIIGEPSEERKEWLEQRL